ncbi:hypothetical protein Slin14017_G127540 [Septoria linicola]|nr:hypothetical protein Slin14017_G127540 [Septoria linicola]
MEMPGGAVLGVLQSSSSSEDAGFLTIPRELRDLIYHGVDDTIPHQCRVCSLVIHGADKCFITEHESRTAQQYVKTNGSAYKNFHSPFITRFCRNKIKSRGYGVHCGHAHRITFLRVNDSESTPMHHHKAIDRAVRLQPEAHSAKRNTFPILAHVSWQLRAEVLSQIFSKSRLYATLFDRKSDGLAIVQGIRDMGQECAATIQDLYIAYSKKKMYKYIMKTLGPQLQELGLRFQHGVLKPLRLMEAIKIPNQDSSGSKEIARLPGCHCEYCIVQCLRIEDRRIRGVKSRSKNEKVRLAARMDQANKSCNEMLMESE